VVCFRVIEMTGKRYYITTFGDWARYSASFANSHWLVVGSEVLARCDGHDEATSTLGEIAMISDKTDIVVLIEADEGAHLLLDDHPYFEPLPHPLSGQAISGSAHTALAPLGVKPGDSTFDVAEAISQHHPLLRHCVY
jgi:hypothetical protein